MMSEIEKLMQNVGVTKIGNKKCTPAEFLDCQNYCFISENNKCDKFSYDYLPFTAEKQLGLIKWLAKRKDFALDYYPSCNIWVAKTDFQWEHYEKIYEHKETKQALAGLINSLWQDLTDTEKAEIKRILE